MSKIKETSLSPLDKKIASNFILFIANHMRINNPDHWINYLELFEAIRKESPLYSLLGFLDKISFNSKSTQVKVFSNIDQVYKHLQDFVLFEILVNEKARYLGFDKKSYTFMPRGYSELIRQANTRLSQIWQEVDKEYSVGKVKLDLVGKCYINGKIQPMVGVEIHSINWEPYNLERHAINRNYYELKNKTGFPIFYIFDGLWFDLNTKKYVLNPINFKDAINNYPDYDLSKNKKKWVQNLPTNLCIPGDLFRQQIEAIAIKQIKDDTLKLVDLSKKDPKRDSFIKRTLLSSGIPVLDESLTNYFDQIYTRDSASKILSERSIGYWSSNQYLRTIKSKNSDFKKSIINRNRILLDLNPRLSFSFRELKKNVLFFISMIENKDNHKDEEYLEIQGNFLDQGIIDNLYAIRNFIMHKNYKEGSSFTKTNFLGVYILQLLIAVQDGGKLYTLIPNHLFDEVEWDHLYQHLYKIGKGKVYDLYHLFDDTSDDISHNYKYKMISLTKVKPSLVEFGKEFFSSIDNQLLDTVDDIQETESGDLDIIYQIQHWFSNELYIPKRAARSILKRIEKKFIDQTFEMNKDEIIKEYEFIKQKITKVINPLNEITDSIGKFKDYYRVPDPEPTKYNLFNLISEAVRIFESSNKSKTKNLKIIVDDIPKEIELLIDDGQIKSQVFIQAMENVIKHAFDNKKHKKVEINFSVNQDIQKRSDYWHIIIADNGKGMVDTSNLFKPFSRGDSVGLAFMKQVIENHGGLINIHSDNGMVINIYLPTVKKSEEFFNRKD